MMPSVKVADCSRRLYADSRQRQEIVGERFPDRILMGLEVNRCYDG
jgi:hypothetical protein